MHHQAALIAAGGGLAFVALELTLHVATAIAGVFVIGMAGGLLLGGRLASPAKP